MDREVKYRVLNKRASESGSGRTINMSSSGILFTTDQLLVPGRTVELSVNWPAQLANGCPLKLVARGRVTRFGPGLAAIEMQHHEFRTVASSPLPGPTV